MRALILLSLLLAAPASAAETRTAAPGAAPPPAVIADLAWLEGPWEGEGLGGEAHEAYAPPAHGQIVGYFRHVKNGAIAFYELVTFAEVGGSLEMRVKHFNADLTGWEEKNDVQRFALVAVEKDVWYFDGLTVRRTGPDTMITTVLVKQRDGTTSEFPFHYRRVP
ncbi:MAG: DUF6265 family protein [Rhodospirillaceae bacterium]|nr:DUF6265 family protein [Rhodospirillaceae bacterium]